MNLNFDLRTRVVAGTALLLAGMLFLFAYNAYPPPLSDAACFLPPAITLKAHHTLEVTPLCDIVGDGSKKYLQYPALFQLVLSHMMMDATPMSAFLSIAVLDGLTILLSGLFFVRSVRSGIRKMSWYNVALISLSLAGIAALFTYHAGGRPEALASLVLVSAMVATQLVQPRWHWAIHGIALGIMGCTHPAGAVLLGLIISVLGFFKHTAARFLLSLAKTLAVSLVIFLCLMSASPNGILATIRGVAAHASLEVARSNSWGLWDFWIVSPNAMFFGVLFSFSLFGIAYLVFTRRRDIRSPIAAAIASTILVAATYYLAFRIPARVYNCTLFAPLFFWGNLEAMNAIGADFPLYRRQLIFVKTAFLLAAAMSTVSFLRVTALFPYFVKNGMSLEQARERFRTIDLSQYQKIGVTSSMWVLSENYDHTFLVPYQLPVVVSGARYPIIIQQNYWQSTVAPPVEGYAIAHDFFSPDVPRLFGVKLASTMPGYAFAVYLPNQFDNTTGQAGRSSVSATDSEPWHQAK